MEALILNLDIGTLTLKKRGKKGTFWLDIHFYDLEENKRFRATTKTNKIKEAKPKAIAMAQDEYRRRKAGIFLQRTTTPQRYLKDTHIPWLWKQVGIPLDNNRKIVMTERKARNDTDILMRWFYRYLERRSWESLETARFGRDITSFLRENIADTTIASYIGAFNRFMRQAEMDEFITINKVLGVPALAQSDGDDEHGYASATQEMMEDLLEHSEKVMKEATRKDTKRTYTQAYAMLRILADTGIRPFFNVPLCWSDIDDQGDLIRLNRREKGKRYNAQGTEVTREALDDLRQFYLSEGTNVTQHIGLPIIHHSSKGNKYGKKVIQPFAHIERFSLTLLKLMKECGWYDKTDELGRGYRCYSIRKWHINKSIDIGENGLDVANRVGHTYAVLEKFYLNKNRKQKVKANIWQNNIQANTIFQPTTTELNIKGR